MNQQVKWKTGVSIFIGSVLIGGGFYADAQLSAAVNYRDDGDCCFEWNTCPNGSVAEDCMGSRCQSNRVCSGEGGCDPATGNAWALAKCIKKPGTIEPGDGPTPPSGL